MIKLSALNKFIPFIRIFFGLMFVMMVLLSVYFISNVYAKYSAKPMIISLNSVSTDIKNLPFPGKFSINLLKIKILIINFD